MNSFKSRKYPTLIPHICYIIQCLQCLNADFWQILSMNGFFLTESRLNEFIAALFDFKAFDNHIFSQFYSKLECKICYLSALNIKGIWETSEKDLN